MRLEYLADYPEHLPILAQWHFQEWAYLHPEDASVAREEQFLERTLGKRRVGVTFVALEDETLLGSASLVECDMETRRDLSPWLASVYTAPEYRRRGVGSALVQRVMEEAADIGTRTLYLFTPDQQSFYRRLGWEQFEREHYHGSDVDIMAWKPGKAAGR